MTEESDYNASTGTGNSYFQCTRVNNTTFLVHEKDKYEEHPFIYVKVYDEPPLIVLSDTGCGGGSNKHPHSKSLREYLETCPIPANQDRPLNPRDSEGKASKKYMIICTHCHYDHILGIEQFAEVSPEVVASREGKSFIEQDLPVHSLCKSLGIPTPQYHITQWPQDFGTLSFNGKDLGLQIIHTPGHTSDELAWYDIQERSLFVGDSFYERVAKDKSYEQAILFPKEGNVVDYVDSLKKLHVFVDTKNNDDDAHKGPLKIGCGHITSSVDARGILLGVEKLFQDILEDKVPVVRREQKRGEEVFTWREDGEPRFSVTAPERIMLDAQQDMLGRRDGFS